MILRLTACATSVQDKIPVRFIRKGYRPDGFPFGFPDEEKEAEVWLAPGETVKQVMDYHYPGKYQLVDTGEHRCPQVGDLVREQRSGV